MLSLRPRILFDYQPALGGRNTGLGTYVWSLYVALTRAGLPITRIHRGSALPIRTIPERLLYEQLFLPLAISGDVLFHGTGISYPLLYGRGIATLYDPAFLEHPEWFSGPLSRWYWTRFLPRTIPRAACVVTLTQWSAERLRSLRPSWDLPLRVIPAPLPPDLPQEPAAKRRGILFVGDESPRKNLAFFLRILRLLRKKGFREPAHIVGAAPRPAPEGAVFHGYLPRAALLSLYRQVRALVFVSQYEGFGYPPLEALASGTPTLAFPLPPLKEVYSGRLHYLETPDPHLWAEAILALPDGSAVDVPDAVLPRQIARQFAELYHALL